MLHATIRRVETFEIDVKGEGLPAVHEALDAARPEGFVLAKAPVAMAKGETAITAHGTFVRRDGLREISAETFDELRALVPEGWQMLGVIRD